MTNDNIINTYILFRLGRNRSDYYSPPRNDAARPAAAAAAHAPPQQPTIASLGPPYQQHTHQPNANTNTNTNTNVGNSKKKRRKQGTRAATAHRSHVIELQQQQQQQAQQQQYQRNEKKNVIHTGYNLEHQQSAPQLQLGMNTLPTMKRTNTINIASHSQSAAANTGLTNVEHANLNRGRILLEANQNQFEMQTNSNNNHDNSNNTTIVRKKNNSHVTIHTAPNNALSLAFATSPRKFANTNNINNNTNNNNNNTNNYTHYKSSPHFHTLSSPHNFDFSQLNSMMANNNENGNEIDRKNRSNEDGINGKKISQTSSNSRPMTPIRRATRPQRNMTARKKSNSKTKTKTKRHKQQTTLQDSAPSKNKNNESNRNGMLPFPLAQMPQVPQMHSMHSNPNTSNYRIHYNNNNNNNTSNNMKQQQIQYHSNNTSNSSSNHNVNSNVSKPPPQLALAHHLSYGRPANNVVTMHHGQIHSQASNNANNKALLNQMQHTLTLSNSYSYSRNFVIPGPQTTTQTPSGGTVATAARTRSQTYTNNTRNESNNKNNNNTNHNNGNALLSPLLSDESGRSGRSASNSGNRAQMAILRPLQQHSIPIQSLPMQVSIPLEQFEAMMRPVSYPPANNINRNERMNVIHNNSNGLNNSILNQTDTNSNSMNNNAAAGAELEPSRTTLTPFVEVEIDEDFERQRIESPQLQEMQMKIQMEMEMRRQIQPLQPLQANAMIEEQKNEVTQSHLISPPIIGINRKRKNSNNRDAMQIQSVAKKKNKKRNKHKKKKKKKKHSKKNGKQIQAQTKTQTQIAKEVKQTQKQSNSNNIVINNNTNNNTNNSSGSASDSDRNPLLTDLLRLNGQTAALGSIATSMEVEVSQVPGSNWKQQNMFSINSINSINNINNNNENDRNENKNAMNEISVDKSNDLINSINNINSSNDNNKKNAHNELTVTVTTIDGKFGVKLQVVPKESEFKENHGYYLASFLISAMPIICEKNDFSREIDNVIFKINEKYTNQKCHVWRHSKNSTIKSLKNKIAKLVGIVDPVLRYALSFLFVGACLFLLTSFAFVVCCCFLSFACVACLHCIFSKPNK